MAKTKYIPGLPEPKEDFETNAKQAIPDGWIRTSEKIARNFGHAESMIIGILLNRLDETERYHQGFNGKFSIPMSDLSKRSGIDRNTIYKITDDLKGHGLLDYQAGEVGKKYSTRYYRLDIELINKANSGLSKDELANYRKNRDIENQKEKIIDNGLSQIQDAHYLENGISQNQDTPYLENKIPLSQIQDTPILKTRYPLSKKQDSAIIQEDIRRTKKFTKKEKEGLFSPTAHRELESDNPSEKDKPPWAIAMDTMEDHDETGKAPGNDIDPNADILEAIESAKKQHPEMTI